jgi:hypothetical protein
MSREHRQFAETKRWHPNCLTATRSLNAALVSTGLFAEFDNIATRHYSSATIAGSRGRIGLGLTLHYLSKKQIRQLYG